MRQLRLRSITMSDHREDTVQTHTHTHTQREKRMWPNPFPTTLETIIRTPEDRLLLLPPDVRTLCSLSRREALTLAWEACCAATQESSPEGPGPTEQPVHPRAASQAIVHIWGASVPPDPFSTLHLQLEVHACPSCMRRTDTNGGEHAVLECVCTGEERRLCC